MSDLAFSSERKNRNHLSRIRPLSRSSLPSSSRAHCDCDSTFFVSSSCTDLMFWKNPCWCPMRNCFSRLNHVALEEANDCYNSHPLQPITCLADGPPQLRIRGVHFQALSRCVHRISRSLQLSFRLGVSTPTSPWSPSFLGWNHQFSGPHDGCGECGFHVVHTAVSRRVFPKVLSNRCGHVLSELGISHQTRTATGGLAVTLNRRFRAKWPMGLTGADTMLWSELGRKEGWGCTVTFRTTLRLRCLVRTWSICFLRHREFCYSYSPPLPSPSFPCGHWHHPSIPTAVVRVLGTSSAALLSGVFQNACLLLLNSILCFSRGIRHKKRNGLGSTA